MTKPHPRGPAAGRAAAPPGASAEAAPKAAAGQPTGGAARRFSLAPFAPEISLSASLAIVGNSSALSGAGHGPAIDAHSDVLRFNFAQIKGYEADIGRKTTIRFYGGTIQTEQGALNAARRIREPKRIPLVTRPHNRPMAPLAFPGRKVVYFQQWDRAGRGAYSLLARYSGLQFDVSRQPRSGIVLLAIMLSATDGELVPTLFGFDTRDLTHAQWKEHYFDQRTKPDFLQVNADYHAPIEYEWETLLALDRRGHIRLVGGSA